MRFGKWVQAPNRPDLWHAYALPNVTLAIRTRRKFRLYLVVGGWFDFQLGKFTSLSEASSFGDAVIRALTEPSSQEGHDATESTTPTRES